jgi:hypothetical protein
MAQLYSDEDFSHSVVEELRRLGHDVLTAQEAGLANLRIADSAVLAFAVVQGRAVLTFNRRHFINWHRNVSIRHGTVVCTRDNDVLGLALRIHQAITSCPSLDNHLLRIYRPQSRESSRGLRPEPDAAHLTTRTEIRRTLERGSCRGRRASACVCPIPRDRSY